MSTVINRYKLMACVVVSLLTACSTSPTVGIDALDVTPRLASDAKALDKLSPTELAHLQLIATNLIGTLVQIPEMNPSIATLQVNKPKSAFGNAITRALEDAGFGLQLVSADQGQQFVSYSKRLAETESGLVTDYELAVGKIRLSREYLVQDQAIYPSSLMNIDGTDYIADINLADNIFTEQGGQNTAFISGAQQAGTPNPALLASTVDVNDFDEIPQNKRTPQEQVFADARKRFFEIDAARAAPDLSNYLKYRRTVLIFDNDKTQMLGRVNKQAVRLMVREFSDQDLMVIKACQAADGSDEASMTRAIRVEEELAGYGIPAASAYIAPCARTSYRHASDNSPTPVELIHYRPQKS